jgi:hypothetical protein
MAATYPSRDPERSEGTSPPRLAAAPEPANVARRSIWRWVLLGVAIVAAVVVIGYFVLYSGGGGGVSGGSGGGGGGYFVLALPLERLARVVRSTRPNRS